MATEDKTLKIVVDDGAVKVPVYNTHDVEVGMFYFHPTDIGIVQRYNKFAEDFPKILEPLEHVSINPDGTGESDEDTQALQAAEKRLYEACDYMFGGNMSEAFFGDMHPFSPVNGLFYCENVLNSVGSFIQMQFDSEVKKINARVSKYTKQYQRKRK